MNIVKRTFLPLLLLLAVVSACKAPVPKGGPASEPTSPRRSATMIEHTPARMRNESGVNLVLEGELRNVSNETLTYVKSNVSFYDKDGHFITSEDMYHISKWQGLAPGEKSSFLVQTRYDPRIKRFSLEFSDKEGPLPSVEVKKLK